MDKVSEDILFKEGSAKDIINYIEPQLVTLEEVGVENEIWLEGGRRSIHVFIPLLVWMRDTKDFSLSLQSFFDFIYHKEDGLESIIHLVKTVDIPINLKQPLVEYIETLIPYPDDWEGDKEQLNVESFRMVGDSSNAYNNDFLSDLYCEAGIQHGCRAMFVVKSFDKDFLERN